MTSHKKVSLFTTIFVLLQLTVFAQQSTTKWHLASQKNINGRAFSDSLNIYNRLPNRAKSKVRKEVWNLSANSAGLSINFNSNDEIIEGLKLLIQTIKTKQASAKVIVVGILPRRNEEDRIASKRGINKQLIDS